MENWTNSSTIAQTNLQNASQTTNDPTYVIVCPLVGLIGLALNLITLAIMSSFKQPLYFYLRLELTFICLDEFVTILKPIYYCRSCSISTTLFANAFYYGFNVYLASVLELGALLSRNMSALICFLLISNHLRQLRFVLKKSSCMLIMPVIVIFSLLVYIYQLFEYKITCVNSTTRLESSPGLTIKVCQIEKTWFGLSATKKWIEMVVMLFRDGINVGVLLVFNILIIILTRQNLEDQKNELNASSQHRSSRFERYLEYCNNTAMIRRQAHKENRQSFMVIITCCNCLLGRLPILFFFIKRNVTSTDDKSTRYAALMVYISYSVYFFLYYQSSYKFRKLVNMYAERIVGRKESIKSTKSSETLPSKKF